MVRSRRALTALIALHAAACDLDVKVKVVDPPEVLPDDPVTTWFLDNGRRILGPAPVDDNPTSSGSWR